MTALVRYVSKEEETLNEIKKHIKLLGEQSTQITTELVTLYDLWDLIEAPSMVKFKKLDCWRKAQKVLELLETIHEKAT